MVCGREVGRRELLLAGSSAVIYPAVAAAGLGDAKLRFGLTPVFLNSDVALLGHLQAYLEHATGLGVQLVTRRTYQEITALLVSRQLNAAWICGYPFVAYRKDLSLVAVPIWRGKTLYQSYLIAHESQPGDNLAALKGSVHAFSDPDSNSGYLVTRASLAELGVSPASFFRQSFFTYGHRNVIRAVASGLAGSGSVDGYVYEVLRETDPDLVRATRVVSRSEWLGFPPIACPSGEAFSTSTVQVRAALLGMNRHPKGVELLGMLRLDGFKLEPVDHYDGIAAKVAAIRSAEE